MIFREVLNSDLPPEEKTIDRLWHDGQVFNIAGAETTAWTLGNITYYLLAKPEILKRLQEEFRTVVKDGRVEETSTAELEQLPYLVCSLLKEFVGRITLTKGRRRSLKKASDCPSVSQGGYIAFPLTNPRFSKTERKNG
jgi:hypothetical protein